MQTIKVNVKREKENVLFLINGKQIANIGKDFFNKGRYSGGFGGFGSCNNLRFPEALEFISDCIEKHFAKFNLSVNFE